MRQQPRGKRMGGSTFVGKVVSNRMQKTVVVAVNYVVWVPKYKVYEKRVSRHKARDEAQSCVIGDIVRIRHARRFSRHTSYKVVDTLRQASVFDRGQAAALVAQRDAGRPTDRVQVAQDRLQEVELRLAKLREMYEREMGQASITGTLLANSGAAGTLRAQSAPADPAKG